MTFEEIWDALALPGLNVPKRDEAQREVSDMDMDQWMDWVDWLIENGHRPSLL